MPAGIATTNDEQNVVRCQAAVQLALFDQCVRTTIGVLFVVLALSVLADRFHTVDCTISLLEEISLHVTAAPAGTRDHAYVFRRHDDGGLAERNTAVIGHCVRDAV